MPKDLPPPELLRKLLRYEPETGKLFWRERQNASFNTVWAGKEAFTARRGGGYRVGSVACRMYCAHRVIWAIVHGAWPEGQIDHINGIRGDNRLANLRCVTPSENAKNQRIPKSNTSGAMGVGWDKKNKKWLVTIKSQNVMRHVGRFADFDAAVEARRAAEAEHGFHENHGLSSV